MAIFNTAAKLALKPVPRLISPKGHAIIDYMTIGSFFMSAAWFWSRSKRAALAAAICGGAELAITLLTDYPGGMKKAIPFRIHGDIDLGLASMTAAMPEFLAFEDHDEKRFFLAQGAMITAVRQLTKFSRPSVAERRRRTTKAA
jgi:hypothetical protein